MEVKSGEGTVVVADRNRYSDECCNNRGWDSGWGAAGKYEVVLMIGAGNIDRLVEPVKEILCKQIRKP